MKNWLDKILLIVALIVAGAATYIGLKATTSDEATQGGTAGPTGKQFAKDLPAVQAPEVELWPEPAAQEADWIFEVFTPPRIYFNQQSTEFVVELPTEGAVVRQVTPFGMELVEIRRDVYRVQLSAYSGDFGNFRVNDQYVVRGRPGREFEDEKFRLISLVEERHVDDSVEGETPIITRRGVATILDLTNNREYVLKSDEVALADFPVAEVQVRTRSINESRVMTQGEVWEVAGARYKLDAINEAEGTIVVTKVALDDESEVETETLSASGRFELSNQRDQFIDLLEVVPAQGGSGAEAPAAGEGFFDSIETEQ